MNTPILWIEHLRHRNDSLEVFLKKWIYMWKLAHLLHMKKVNTVNTNTLCGKHSVSPWAQAALELPAESVCSTAVTSLGLKWFTSLLL